MFKRIGIFIGCMYLGCTSKPESLPVQSSSVQYAQGFKLQVSDTYSVLRIGSETMVLHTAQASIPDSLQKYPKLTVPISKIVVTSTTHIPSLEALNVEQTLVGFPNIDLISSAQTRKRIDKGKITEVGKGQQLLLETLLALQPQVLVGYSVTSESAELKQLRKMGIPVLLNSDWKEQNPLARAEWIKFFGALYHKNKQADSLFKNIEKKYHSLKKIAAKTGQKPTVFCGSIFKDTWYMPQGNNWAAQLIADANGDYLWKNTTGNESLALSFEMVLAKAQKADYWIGSQSYMSLQNLKAENPNFAYFNAFQKGNIYTYTGVTGVTGGSLFYEVAPNRPDWVLEDIIKILHPETLPNHTLRFYKQLP